jgi:hypothetical protein
MFNKNNVAEYLPFIHALAEGKTIEVNIDFGKNDKRWVEVSSLNFDRAPRRYRVKVEPPPPCELWVNIYDSGGPYAHFSEDSALANAGPEVVRKAVHLREVIE